MTYYHYPDEPDAQTRQDQRIERQMSENAIWWSKHAQWEREMDSLGRYIRLSFEIGAASVIAVFVLWMIGL